MLNNITINKILIATGGLALVLVAVFWLWWNRGISFEISNNNNEIAKAVSGPESPISGMACDNLGRRPLAVMLASDPVTRPLSGLADADMIFEMPVTDGGVTRFMAVYQCNEPGEIGSIRSAREDFIPLAAGLGAVYAHWGGERSALEKLDGHIIDNIDALKYEEVYFFRKKGVRPHNGFSDMKRLWKAVEDLKYARDNTFAGYPHGFQDTGKKNLANMAETITVNYPPPYDVVWNYDRERNVYKRTRGGTPEMDRTGGQAEASVVAVMETSSSYISKDYINVRVAGEGSLRIYQNGTVMLGKWRKGETISEKLFFLDSEGKEIKFVPGKIWVQIVTGQSI